jgi:serine/threonine-protein kinase
VGEDVSLRRRVAVKVLHPALAGDEAFLRRFRAEARVVAALRHPNILRVYDWGEDGGSPYLVTELLEGGSLRTLLDAGQLLSPAQAARVGADAARALAHAHRRGLVHRDIKPANLLFDDEGRVSVADFGLARALAEASWTEPVGAVVGTARYAAPEQARGQSLDARGDVYALALVLVEATTGEVPFTADTTIGTLMARLDRPLPVPANLGPLAGPLNAAGAAAPADRCDAIVFAAELDRVAAELPPPSALALSGPLATGLLEVDPEPTALEGGRSRPETPDAPTVFFDDHPGASATGAPHGPWVDDDPTGPGIRPPRRVGPTPPVVTPPGTGPSAPAAAPYDGEEDQPLRDDLDATRTGAAIMRPAPVGGGRRRGRRILLALAVLIALVAAAGGALWATGVLPPTPNEAVPSVLHQTTAAATASLARAHLRIEVVGKAYDNTVPAGSVLTQRPGAGHLKRGKPVAVTVSLGLPPVPVPSLQGATEAQAVEKLRAAHLKVGSVTPQASTTVASGTVISWSGDGATLPQGTPVNLVVSSGLPFVAVPALNGPSAQSFAAAQSALAGAGLSATQAAAYSDTVAKGLVISTTPAAGSKVRLHTPVTVTVSKGPDTTPVPSVYGDSVSYATAVLEANGLAVSGVQGNPTAAATGTYPSQATVVRLGAAVEIITS